MYNPEFIKDNKKKIIKPKYNWYNNPRNIQKGENYPHTVII